MTARNLPLGPFVHRHLPRWVAALAALVAIGPVAHAAEFVWLEGEKPAHANYQPKAEGVGRPEFLSERAWLRIAIDAGQVEREAPADGVLLEYACDAKAAGNYEVWARIGYEFVRSPFDWRLDGGEWKSVSPDELTTDLMELSFWTEVAWLKLGQQPLAAGRIRLSFRLPKTKDAQGKPQRILFALDCVCLTTGEFRPYQFYKPGEDHQTDQDRAGGEAGVPVAGARGPSRPRRVPAQRAVGNLPPRRAAARRSRRADPRSPDRTAMDGDRRAGRQEPARPI